MPISYLSSKLVVYFTQREARNSSPCGDFYDHAKYLSSETHEFCINRRVVYTITSATTLIFKYILKISTSCHALDYLFFINSECYFLLCCKYYAFDFYIFAIWIFSESDLIYTNPGYFISFILFEENRIKSCSSRHTSTKQ